MDQIKQELNIEKQMCHGCLSVDRNLNRLRQNRDLFFMLLNNSAILPHRIEVESIWGYYDSCGPTIDDIRRKDLSFLNIMLCWECIAILRKIKTFQNRIQKAQEHLGNWILPKNFESNLKTLSSLKIINRYNLDFTFNDDDNQVKVEWTLPKSEEKYSDIKEEFSDVDDFDGLPNDDIDVYNNADIHTDHKDILIDTKKLTKVKNKSRLKDKRLKPSTSKFDMSKINSYISKVTYTINDLEILKKEKLDEYKNLHKKITDRFRKLVAMKSKDIAKSKSENSYTCSCCNNEFTEETLENHWSEHSIVTFKCDLCNKHFIYQSDVSVHMKGSHRKVYTCPLCGISFSWRREYTNHYRELHQSFVCEHCGKHFSNKHSIEKHMRCNHLPAKCGLCQLTFEKYEKLRKHQRRQHAPAVTGMKRELCYCVECNKQYPHPDAYKQHLRNSAAHTPRKITRVPCPECGRVFTRATYMNNHYRLVHVKQSKHHCQICDKYYINGYALRTHRKYVHEKAEKPRLKICDICGKGFNATRTLVNHRRTHTGERPYRCPHCPAAFAQLSAQKTHARTQHKYLK